METYKEQVFLEYVIKAIVTKPDEVKIERTVDEMGVLYTLDVSQDDVAKVIGREGQIAKALRLLLRTVGYNEKVRANMKINAPRIEKPEAKKTEDDKLSEELKL